MSHIEEEVWGRNKLLIGVDEVAYGNLFGSLFIAGVVFPKGFDFNNIPDLDDSKKVKDVKRFEIEPLITKNALWYFCGEVTPAVIDVESAYHAKYRVAKEHIETCSFPHEDISVLMDGNVIIKGLNVESKCLIKGDSLCKTISAASILAKCAQRRQILSLADDYSEYDIANNNGYHSKKHRAALIKYGPTPYHRKTYIKKICAV